MSVGAWHSGVKANAEPTSTVHDIRQTRLTENRAGYQA